MNAFARQPDQRSKDAVKKYNRTVRITQTYSGSARNGEGEKIKFSREQLSNEFVVKCECMKKAKERNKATGERNQEYARRGYLLALSN